MSAKSKKSSSVPPQEDAASSNKKRILLVDDHPFMRAGLGQLIDRQADMQVCGEAGTPAEALSLLAAARPDLVLSDLIMPGRGGLEFIKDLKAASASLAILVVSMHDESVFAERVLRAGGRGYIMKEAGGENLLTAIRQVLKGEVYVSPRMAARILENLSGARPRGTNSSIERLSDREFEVFQLIGQGKAAKEIAAQLNLSSKTVDVHRANIKEKLGLPDVTALIRHAVRWVESQGTAS